MIEFFEDATKRLGLVSSPLGLGILGAAALVAKSPKGRKAARSVAVGTVGVLLGVVDGAKELTAGMRKSVMDMVDEAKVQKDTRSSMRTGSEVEAANPA